MATREELHQLVSSLAEEALDAAHAALTCLQAGPSLPLQDDMAALEQFHQAQQRVHERMQERSREMVQQLARQNRAAGRRL